MVRAVLWLFGFQAESLARGFDCPFLPGKKNVLNISIVIYKSDILASFFPEVKPPGLLA